MTRRGYKAVLLAAVVLALGASEAQAHTPITCDPCSYPYQQWVDEARVPTPGGTLAVVEHSDQPGDCDHPALGCTDGNTIWLAPWPSDRKATFFHELGHIFALENPTLATFTDERFAAAYSLCARLRRIDRRWTYTGPGRGIGGGSLRRLCRVIRRA